MKVSWLPLKQHQTVLQNNHTFLLNNVQYDDVCDHLIECGILSFDKHEEINCEKSNKAKVCVIYKQNTRYIIILVL